MKYLMERRVEGHTQEHDPPEGFAESEEIGEDELVGLAGVTETMPALRHTFENTVRDGADDAQTTDRRSDHQRFLPTAVIGETRPGW